MSLPAWAREARERLDAATPGPWWVKEPTEYQCGSVTICSNAPADAAPGEGPWIIGSTDSDETDAQNEAAQADAEFIAHAPTDLRLVLEALERVEAVPALDRSDEAAPVVREYAAGYNAALADVRAAITGGPDA